MWTSENRYQYERQGRRYPTDLSDPEWDLVEPHIRPARRGGRRRTTDMREVTNAILYLLGTACQCPTWQTDSPPRRASRRVRRPAQRPRSSTARASRAPKKGGADRPVGL